MFDEGAKPGVVDTQAPITTKTIAQSSNESEATAALNQGDAEGAVKATVAGQMQEQAEAQTQDVQTPVSEIAIARPGSNIRDQVRENQQPLPESIATPGAGQPTDDLRTQAGDTPNATGEQSASADLVSDRIMVPRRADQVNNTRLQQTADITQTLTETQYQGLTPEQQRERMLQLSQNILQTNNLEDFLNVLVAEDQYIQGLGVEQPRERSEAEEEIRKRGREFIKGLASFGIDWAGAGYRDSSVSQLLDFMIHGTHSGYRGLSQGSPEFTPDKLVGLDEFKNKMKDPNQVGAALLRAITDSGDNLARYGWHVQSNQLDALKKGVADKNVYPGLVKDMFKDLTEVWKTRGDSWNAFANIFYQKLFDKTDSKLLHPQIEEYIVKTLVEKDQWMSQLGNNWQ